MSDIEDIYTRATEAVASKFRDPKATYIVETLNMIEPPPQAAIIRGAQLDFQSDLSSLRISEETTGAFDTRSLSCSHFCVRNNDSSMFTSIEEVKFIYIYCV